MFELGAGERSELLELARRALEFFFETQSLLHREPRHSSLHSSAGVFVSLHSNAMLRGCVGRVKADLPLYKAVPELTLAAAFEDSRFPPLRRDELAEVEIEVSVLSDILPIASLKEIALGRHGLIVTKGEHRGLLLPQVAAERGWDCFRFFRETCRKAGLPPDSWCRGAMVERFSAQVFREAGHAEART